MTTWILEKDLATDGVYEKMVTHLESKNIQYKAINVFNGEIGDNKVPVVDGPVVFYGGISNIAERYGWNPGVFTSKDFNFKTYHDYLAPEDAILNIDYELCPLNDIFATAMRRGWEDVFVRPNLDSKEFSGMVVNINESENWIEKLISMNYIQHNNFDVILAAPQNIQAEYRLIMVDGKMVAASQYRRNHKLNKKEGCLPIIKEMAERLDKAFRPAPIYVIDIAETISKWDTFVYKVIEYGHMNFCGLYDCNVGAVIDAVTAYVDKNYTEKEIAA